MSALLVYAKVRESNWQNVLKQSSIIQHVQEKVAMFDRPLCKQTKILNIDVELTNLDAVYFSIHLQQYCYRKK